MRTFLKLCILLLLVGCAKPDYNYLPTITDVSFPEIDSINTAYVGDVLLKQGTYREHAAIYLPYQEDIGFAYTLHPGYYLKQGEDDNSETYLPYSGDEGGRVTKAMLADPWQAVMTYKKGNKLCVVTVFNAFTCSKGKFERTSKPILSRDSFQQTLLYNGKIGDKLNIGYREFSGNIARPAFNNAVEYDLSESKVIGYKGARLEIIEATNQFLTYRVISNFNNASK